MLKSITYFLIILGLTLFILPRLTNAQRQNKYGRPGIKLNHPSKSNPNFFLEWLEGITGPIQITTTTQKPQIDIQTNCPPCVCGITNKKTRIVGGYETYENQYPWATMLYYLGRFYCGGSLLNDRYVITAAHCISGFQHDRVTLHLLRHSRLEKPPTVIVRSIEKVVQHRQYSASTYNNDIALIRLNETVEIKGLLRPVCLPTPAKAFVGETATVIGWGALKEGGQPSPILQEVKVPIMSNTECRKSNYGSARITDNMLCAGYPQGEKDSCQGDSGGPLHVVDNELYQIAGVVSWGEGCAQPKYPGVYTRVNRFLTWIKANTKDACYCSNVK